MYGSVTLPCKQAIRKPMAFPLVENTQNKDRCRAWKPTSGQNVANEMQCVSADFQSEFVMLCLMGHCTLRLSNQVRSCIAHHHSLETLRLSAQFVSLCVTATFLLANVVSHRLETLVLSDAVRAFGLTYSSNFEKELPACSQIFFDNLVPINSECLCDSLCSAGSCLGWTNLITYNLQRDGHVCAHLGCRTIGGFGAAWLDNLWLWEDAGHSYRRHTNAKKFVNGGVDWKMAAVQVKT